MPDYPAKKLARDIRARLPHGTPPPREGVDVGSIPHPDGSELRVSICDGKFGGEYLLLMEGHDNDPLNRLVIRVRDGAEIVHHTYMAIDAGLIFAQDWRDGMVVNRLANAGHDFLALARDDDRWAEEMRRTAGGQVPFGVLEEVLIQEAERATQLA